MMVVGCDFARVFFLWIELQNAARAGVQYGAQTQVTAAEPAGIAAAAQNDAPDVAANQMTVSSSLCTCGAVGPRTIAVACGAGYCGSDPNATFVEVDTQATFKPLFPLIFPTSLQSFFARGKAVMQVAAAN